MASRLPYPQDHASHIPFLAGIGAAFTIRQVVEFGSGPYSTPLFLNKSAFRKVEDVISVEPSAEWRDKVRDLCGYEERLTLLEENPKTLYTELVDLVFIDNGPEQHKVETIRWMALACTKNVIVVVHDAETPSYRAEIDKFQTKFISEKYNPGTAICSNDNIRELAVEFLAIEMMVKGNYHIPVTDVLSWIEVMNGF